MTDRIWDATVLDETKGNFEISANVPAEYDVPDNPDGTTAKMTAKFRGDTLRATLAAAKLLADDEDAVLEGVLLSALEQATTTDIVPDTPEFAAFHEAVKNNVDIIEENSAALSQFLIFVENYTDWENTSIEMCVTLEDNDKVYDIIIDLTTPGYKSALHFMEYATSDKVLNSVVSNAMPTEDEFYERSEDEYTEAEDALLANLLMEQQLDELEANFTMQADEPEASQFVNQDGETQQMTLNVASDTLRGGLGMLQIIHEDFDAFTQIVFKTIGNMLQENTDLVPTDGRFDHLRAAAEQGTLIDNTKNDATVQQELTAFFTAFTEWVELPVEVPLVDKDRGNLTATVTTYTPGFAYAMTLFDNLKTDAVMQSIEEHTREIVAESLWSHDDIETQWNVDNRS